uniref:RNA-directed RNA polymerase n=1 Tax=Erysiphales associated totivirus 19 TaxID=2719848 RepID=A0A6G9ELM7_9VIRU|nr:RNA-dependent RNA polymerase [Erysiphales associated totivirus 19]
MFVDVDGSQVLAEVVYNLKYQLTCIYVDGTTELMGKTKGYLACNSRILHGPTLFPYGDNDEATILGSVFKIDLPTARQIISSIQSEEESVYPNADYAMFKGSLIEKVLEKKITMNVSRVSASHLRHVTIHELRRIPRGQLYNAIAPVKTFLDRLITAGLTEVFFVGIVVYLLNLPKPHWRVLTASGLWHLPVVSEAGFFDYIKANITSKLKPLQNLVEMDLAPFFELEVLVNRGSGAVDWKQEKLNRTEVNVCTVPEDMVYKKGLELFSRCRKAGSKPRKRDWKEFWDSRWEWAPTGSYHSQYDSDKRYASAERETRNKLNSLCRMPEYPFDHFSSRKPGTYAWPSTKYEWGKQRGIYGVDITNFIMSAFSMSDCEDVISALFPIGKTATSENVRRTVKETLRNGVPFCFDFEDFNSQHSNSNMCAVLQAYCDVFKQDLTLEQVEALMWVKAAIMNTVVVEDGVNGNCYKCRGTLLSGWRLTTFMNTILNAIYVSAADMNANFVTTHSGDDVLAAARKMSDIRDFLNRSNGFNIRYQYTKCHVGAIAEFLRVDHNRGNGTQYLSRAVSTLVHGATESAIPNDLRSNLEALITRRNEVQDRGGNADLLQKILIGQLRHQAVIFGYEVQELVNIINTHRSLGGINDSKEDYALEHRVRLVRDTYTPAGTSAEAAKYPGAQAYANKLIASGINESYRKHITQRLIDTLNVNHKEVVGRYAIQKINNTQPKVHTPGTIGIIEKHKRGKIDGDDVTGYDSDTLIPGLVNAMASSAEVRLRADLYGMFRKSYHGRKAVLAKTFGIPLLAIGGKDSYLSNRLKYEINQYDAIKLFM